jgi:hypothetical protein
MSNLCPAFSKGSPPALPPSRPGVSMGHPPGKASVTVRDAFSAGQQNELCHMWFVSGLGKWVRGHVPRGEYLFYVDVPFDMKCR